VDVDKSRLKQVVHMLTTVMALTCADAGARI
jgi:hypothetical protein